MHCYLICKLLCLSDARGPITGSAFIQGRKSESGVGLVVGIALRQQTPMRARVQVSPHGFQHLACSHRLATWKFLFMTFFGKMLSHPFTTCIAQFRHMNDSMFSCTAVDFEIGFGDVSDLTGDASISIEDLACLKSS